MFAAQKPHRACLRAAVTAGVARAGCASPANAPWTAATSGHRQRSQAVSESCIRRISRRDRSAARAGHWPSFRQLAIRPAAMERSIPAQKFLPRPVSKTCGRQSHGSCQKTPANACDAQGRNCIRDRLMPRRLTARTPSWLLNMSRACQQQASGSARRHHTRVKHRSKSMGGGAGFVCAAPAGAQPTSPRQHCCFGQAC